MWLLKVINGFMIFLFYVLIAITIAKFWGDNVGFPLYLRISFVIIIMWYIIYKAFKFIGKMKTV